MSCNTEVADMVRGTDSIAFAGARWEQVHKNHRQWWDHRLGRPLIQMRVNGCASSRAPAAHPFTRFVPAFHNRSADEIVDIWDYSLSTQRFLGDAFPAHWIDYGPGVVASFLGCELGLAEDGSTVWFHPREVKELPQLQFASNQEANPYWQQMLALAAAAGRRWGGTVQLGTTDLGGTLDILSSFRPAEALLYDLYDEPERVEELTWQIHHRWWECYEKLDAALRAGGNPGATCWTPIFSDTSYYMLQCDFGYMLGPDMFARFVIPELAASCRRLDHAFYHLDGIGQLPSLDLILAIPELKGIQWVPGDGQPGLTHWPEVYRKISDAGKLIQIWGGGDEEGLRVVDEIAQQTGRADNIVAIMGVPQQLQGAAEKMLARWGL